MSAPAPSYRIQHATLKRIPSCRWSWAWADPRDRAWEGGHTTRAEAIAHRIGPQHIGPRHSTLNKATRHRTRPEEKDHRPLGPISQKKRVGPWARPKGPGPWRGPGPHGIFYSKCVNWPRKCRGRFATPCKSICRCRFAIWPYRGRVRAEGPFRHSPVCLSVCLPACLPACRPRALGPPPQASGPPQAIGCRARALRVFGSRPCPQSEFSNPFPRPR